MANYQLTPKQESNVTAFKAVLNDAGIKNRVKKSLGKNAGSFMASMLDLYEGDTTLVNCDPTKVAMECLKAASLNLPIVKGLGYAYVVPFKSTPTFIVGYKGYIQLAMRSGQYKIINADCIYEGEEIIFDRLSGQIEIVGQKTGDKAKGYFAYFRLINGFEKSFYMSVEDVKAYGKKYSPSYGTSYSPWTTEFDAMAKKTVLRQIFKYGPMSTEMQMVELKKLM
ncbi:MAG: recombinase RecT [Eubacterium sp.]|nr:recombinase RecT [Eubacterium sp.]